MNLQDYMTITEAAATLNRSVPTIYAYIDAGRLKKEKALGRTLLLAEDVMRVKKENDD